MLGERERDGHQQSAEHNENGGDALQSFQETLGYTFRSRQLLLDALTHRSYAFEYAAPNVMSNERLEFLGDAVLGLLSSDLLYTRFSKATEGELTALRVTLVRASTLAAFARHLALGPHLRLGRGEESTGGRERELLLSRACEALIGALYLDGGMRTVKRVIEPLLVEALQRVVEQRQIKDDKSLLQELAQAQLGVTPTYRVISESGPSHDKTFVVEVLLGEFAAARGEGRSKRQAEQMAARNALADEGWRGKQ